jgi:hypothetical protein
LNDRELHFHLAGINNQNFLMRDEETGSYWQQVTGKAIAGPLKGEQLTLVAQDELTFALWRKERPNGTVLAPIPHYAAKYEKASWEHEIGELPTVIHGTKGTLSDRETIIGIVMDGVAKAYPLNKLTAQSPVLLDTVAGKPIMLVLGSDGKSLRVFSRDVGGATLEFFRPTGTNANEPYTLVDANSLDKWNFEGCAITGDKSGQCLARVSFLKDFWFDWQHYHPHSEIYRH